MARDGPLLQSPTLSPTPGKVGSMALSHCGATVERMIESTPDPREEPLPIPTFSGVKW